MTGSTFSRLVRGVALLTAVAVVYACANSTTPHPEAGRGCPYVHHAPDVGVCDEAGRAACDAWYRQITPAGYEALPGLCSEGHCDETYFCGPGSGAICDRRTEICAGPWLTSQCVCANPDPT